MQGWCLFCPEIVEGAEEAEASLSYLLCSHSFIRCYCVPGTVLGLEGKPVSTTGRKTLFLHTVYEEKKIYKLLVT